MQSLAVAILSRILRATLKMFRRCLGPEHDLKRLPWYCSAQSSSDDGCGAPPLRIMSVCFGQMGQVGRSSRATIVNETWRLCVERVGCQWSTSLNGAATYGIWHSGSGRRHQFR